MAFNCKLCEFLTLVGTIDPQVVADTPVFGDEIAVSGFEELIFVFSLGAVDKTVDCAVWEDTDGAAGGTQALKSATQLTATDDNKQAIINIQRHELSAGFTHVRPRIVCGAAQAAPLSCVVFGANSGPKPGALADLASVAEIKS
jgi:hypothetical protein